MVKKYKRKSKKALSAIIGYVLLITFSVILGIIVYKLLSTYLPKDELACPDGTSLLIKEYTYDCGTNTLVLNFTNNGRFDVGGYFIYGSNAEDKELATIDLTQANTYEDSRFPGGSVGVKFGSFYYGDQNDLKPNEWETETYELDEVGRIYSVDIIPFIWETENRKMKLVSCDQGIIKKQVECN